MNIQASDGLRATELRRLRRVRAMSDFISAEVDAQRSIFRQ
jgi:hypothetical protein